MNQSTSRTGFVAILSALLLLSVTACDAPEDDGRTLILGHAMHVSHPVAIAMQFMADRVEELSEGQLKVEIYPGSQLGGERELLELVQFGTIAITKISGAALENIVHPVQVYSLPYLFRDEDHMWKVMEGEIGQELLDAGIPHRLKGIAYYDAGFRSFYTVARPILTPADLAGLKIRVQPSIMAMSLIRHMGGSPTPMAYSELYTAFQGGVVDGAENNPPSFYTSRHYEVIRYYVLNEHTAVPDILVIGTGAWDQLSEQERGWLQQAVDESVTYQQQLWRESEEESLRIVQEAGVEVIEPDKEPFRREVQSIYDEVRQRDPELYSWVERIQQVQ